ncbi:tetratricopeptide repeat (TPR)-like superfamily protein [Artemisia annua]|uniref:Tetratricopeptide repeat (TPR)-like superfamily protein n=1 Tax=Artemisia annua TaxID=35608 RepID=A0A2U1Q081_ARTAN|nr:tetratricopeptide repeat (TPR)-like superfamily protein [Artemisia annua]
MKRAASTLVLHLKKNPRFHIPICSNHHITQFSSIPTNDSQNDDYPSKSHLKSCLDTHLFLHATRQPIDKFVTFIDPQNQTSQLSPRQEKIKETLQILNEFEAAKTSYEMINVFQKIICIFDDNDLGEYYVKIALKLGQEGEFQEKLFFFANQAFKRYNARKHRDTDKGFERYLPKDRDTDFIVNNDIAVSLAMCSQLSCNACYHLNRLEEAYEYRDRATKYACDIDMGDKDVFEDTRVINLDSMFEKTKYKKAIWSLRICLEQGELLLQNKNKETGDMNRYMAEVFVELFDFGQALPYCESAIQMHERGLGGNSVEVAQDRRLLGAIYMGLEVHEKALEQNKISQKIFRNLGLTSDFLRGEIDAANMKIALRKFDEAMDTLKSVVLQTDAESEDRAMIFVSMAKALFNQNDISEAKNCLQMACEILDDKEKSSPIEVSEAYMEISMQYGKMNELETSVSLLKKTTAMLEKISNERGSFGSALPRIWWLLNLLDKVQDTTNLLKDATESLKEIVGSKHFEVGYVFNSLGEDCMILKRPKSAAQFFSLAEAIMNTALGPHHDVSIEACQNLSRAYSAMESYALAINFQKKVIDAWRECGPSEEIELEIAQRVLKRLEAKACGKSDYEIFYGRRPHNMPRWSVLGED